jgi:N-acetylglutamate synthase-like GNAT family acetyltransferase
MESERFEVRPARPEDYEAAAVLLEGSGLPLDGMREHLGHALVAIAQGAIVGFVAVELHEGAALLRSLAVESRHRGQRLGERLAKEALRMARDCGRVDVYLLTETASGFFPRFGFAVEDRALAPPGLRASVEFRTACPVTAVLMHARLAHP